MVLVVDDEYGPRESVAFTLSSEFEVDTAESGAEALRKIQAKKYQAVILDIRMPDMDGIRALEEIRRLDSLVSVIMLTGYGTLLTAQQAMVGGANQYLRKPPDIAELMSAVRTHAQATAGRRRHEIETRSALEMNVVLKQELDEKRPFFWTGKASIELVHDLNNPLQVVLGNTELLLATVNEVAARDPDLAKRLFRYAELVQKSAEYCRYLSETWRKAVKGAETFSRLNLVDCIQEVHRVLFLEHGAVQVEGVPDAFVRGSKFELMRVFQNLFKNAIEAGASSVKATVSRGETGRIDVEVKDNGAGMDADQLRRALHGGYTSKETGMGLGLGIVRYQLGAHGATFEVKSEPGKGTTIHLSFPAAAQG